MDNIKAKLDKIVSSTENVDELYLIFDSIKDYSLPLIVFYIEAGASLIRQRINESGKYYSTTSSLSYPPITAPPKYGRANIPGHPMFYGCAFPMDSLAPDPRIIAILETSDFAKDEETIGVERFTCSRWDVIEKMKLLSLPFFENYQYAINDILQIQRDWNNEIQKVYINRGAIELVEYMSTEMAKKISNDNDYFKIANFVYYILYINEKTKIFDGLIYPSVPAKGDGFNVVLKPEVVDKKLQFGVASLCYLVKNKMEARVDMINHSVRVSEDGFITYETEKDFDENLYKKMLFVN